MIAHDIYLLQPPRHAVGTRPASRHWRKAAAPLGQEYAYDRKSPVGRLDAALDAAAINNWTVVDMKSDWKEIFPAPPSSEGVSTEPSSETQWKAPSRCDARLRSRCTARIGRCTAPADLSPPDLAANLNQA